jgi:hypothetical protein
MTRKTMNALLPAVLLLACPARAQVVSEAPAALPALFLPPPIAHRAAFLSPADFRLAALSPPRGLAPVLGRRLAALSAALAPVKSPSPELDARSAAKAFEGQLQDLDPAAAEACLQDPRMRGLLLADPRSAAGVMSKAYALRDLAGLLGSARRTRHLYQGLALRLEAGSPLDRMGFNDSKVFLAWVRRHLPEREKTARRAALEWETLPPAARSWLEKFGHPEAKWASYPIDTRDLRRVGWCKEAFEAWMKSPAPADARSWKPFLLEARGFSPGLEREDLFLMNERLRGLNALLHAGIALRNEPAEAGGIFSLPEGRRLDALAESARLRPYLYPPRLRSEIASLRPSMVEESLAAQPRLPPRVTTRLFSELRGTEAGGRILSLFPPGLAPFISLDDGPFIAKYLFESQSIVLNRKVVAGWLRAEGLGWADFERDPDAQRRLGRWLSPILVHEATHHGRSAGYRDMDLLEAPFQEEEIEAFREQFSFILEKSEKDPGFASGIDPKDAFSASRMRLHPLEFQACVRRAYSELPSLAARMASALGLIEVLTGRLEAASDEPQEGPVEIFGMAPAKNDPRRALALLLERAAAETGLFVRFGLRFALTREEMESVRGYLERWAVEMARIFLNHG